MSAIVQSMYKFIFKITEILFPSIAGKWAVDLFFTPFRFDRPHREKAFMEKAKSKNIKFSPDINKIYDLDWAKDRLLNKKFNDVTPKTFYRLYEMGEGPLVLLVHGWSGRASQMGSIAQTLVDYGFKVISFDAFAHGESPGKQTTVLEFVEIINNINRQFGPFYAIVGHSLGGIAAGRAIVKGLKTEKLVTIGSPTTMQFILEAFCKALNASDKTLQYIKNFVERYAKREADDFSLSYLGKYLEIKGLIIHDKNDRETDYDQSLYLDESWQKGRHIQTTGLGHVRILRDKSVLKMIADFIRDDNKEIDDQKKAASA